MVPLPGHPGGDEDAEDVNEAQQWIVLTDRTKLHIRDLEWSSSSSKANIAKFSEKVKDQAFKVKRKTDCVQKV